MQLLATYTFGQALLTVLELALSPSGSGSRSPSSWTCSAAVT